MREKDRLLRQEAAAEAVLFTMGRAVELRELSAALETGEEEAQAAVERLRGKIQGRGQRPLHYRAFRKLPDVYEGRIL